MPQEFEMIRHGTIPFLQAFLVSIGSRNPHWHNDFELIFVLRGSVILNIGSTEHRLCENEIFILNRNEVHSLHRESTDNLLLALQFSPKFCRSIAPALGSAVFEAQHLSMQQHELIAALLIRIAWGLFLQQADYALHCVALLHFLAGALLREISFSEINDEMVKAQNSKQLRLGRIVNYIEYHFSEKVSVAELAKQEGLTSTYFSRFFKEELGITCQQFLNNLRFEHAMKLLLTTNLRLIDICAEVGFSDVKYLNRMFQKEIGCAPAAYRSSHQLNGNKRYATLEALNMQAFVSGEDSIRILAPLASKASDILRANFDALFI